MSLTLKKSTTINVPIDKLWKILADDFENIADWSSSVISSTAKEGTVVPEGALVGGRVCQVPGLGATDESFTDYDAEHYSFTFSLQAAGMPGFVSNLQNRWELHPVNATTTEVRNTVTGDVRGIKGAMMKPLMINRFNKGLEVILADLAHYAEQGNVSPAKEQFLAKQAQKALA